MFLQILPKIGMVISSSDLMMQLMAQCTNDPYKAFKSSGSIGGGVRQGRLRRVYIGNVLFYERVA